MRIGHFFAVFFGIVFLACTALLLACMLGWAVQVQNFIGFIPKHLGYSIAASAILVILSIVAFSLAFVGNGKIVSVASKSQFGQITISDKTIQDIANRAGLSVEGIKEAHPSIEAMPEGLCIVVRVMMLSGYEIPAVVEEMQSRVKDEVEKYAGLRVSEVKVMVQGIETNSAVRLR